MVRKRIVGFAFLVVTLAMLFTPQRASAQWHRYRSSYYTPSYSGYYSAPAYGWSGYYPAPVYSSSGYYAAPTYTYSWPSSSWSGYYSAPAYSWGTAVAPAYTSSGYYYPVTVGVYP